MTVLLIPAFAVSLMASWQRLSRWRRLGVCRDFIRRHESFFRDVDVSTLVVESKPGGVSNSNEIWRLKRPSGEIRSYFVKVFLPLGSFWARHLSALSPFPAVKAGGLHERFTADAGTRARLAGSDVNVPRLIASDEREKVLVTECVDGENVDEILKRVAARGALSDADRRVVRECAAGLANVHAEGFSLIDTQPVNCLWAPAEGKVYFTDLEYSTREDNRGWDVGFFVSFLGLRLPESLREEVNDLFLRTYAETGSLDRASVEATRRKLEDYLPIMEFILDVRQYTPEALVREVSL